MSSIVHSACPLDCPDNCSLEVHVHNGHVIKLTGDHRNPVTQGYICGKVRKFPETMRKERVLFPQKRVGPKGEGKFERISWEEALDSIAKNLAETKEAHGGEAILPVYYGGSNGYLSQHTTDARLFFRLGASNLDLTLCAAPTGAAMKGLYGKMPGVAYQDYVHAKLIVVWGANPEASGIHLMPYIKEAKKRGAKLVVVDPRRTRLAKQADIHLPVYPGTDLPVALSVIHWLFENGHADDDFLQAHARGVDELRAKASRWSLAKAAEVAGLDVKQLEAFVKLYADSSPALVRCGWGQERNRNGGAATAAIVAIPAVAGKFGVRGGGYTMSNSGAWTLDAAAAAYAERPKTRMINLNQVGQALTDAKPAVKTCFVYNCNPLVTLPNQTMVEQGLTREDLFTVVFDPFMTDSAKYADIVLPAATFLEQSQVTRGYGAFVMQQADAAVEPMGESRTNHQVFLELCDRLGLSRDDDLRTEEELRDAMIAAHPDADRIRTELREHGVAAPPSGETPIQFADVFPRTSDEKVDLFPHSLNSEAPRGLYEFEPALEKFPLTLISNATDKTISSTLAHTLDASFGTVSIHPDDAHARGIEAQQRVRVHNEHGEVECLAKVDATMKPGVVWLPKGMWRRHSQNGWTSNALAPDTLTDLGGGACFNDARVEIELI